MAILSGLTDQTARLNALCRIIQGEMSARQQASQSNGTTRPASPGKHQRRTVGDVDDRELLDAAFSNPRNGAEIQRLYQGDWTGYQSQSQADQALCNHLAYYTGNDSERMDRLFRASGLYRAKWDEQHGSRTYGQITIDSAVAITSDFYEPWSPDSENDDESPDATAESEWKPVNFQDPTKLPKFPLEATYSPEIARILRLKSEALQVPSCFLGNWYLGNLASIFQGRYHVLPNTGWRESLSQWVMVGSNSGTGKGPAHGFIFAPLVEWARDLRPKFEALIEELKAEIAWLQVEEQALLKGSGADKVLYTKKCKEIAEKRRAIPAMPTFWADNATPEVVALLLKQNCGRLPIASAESSFSSTLIDPYRGNSRCEELLKGWSWETIQINRIGREPIEVHNPHLTVVAATQNGHLAELLSDPKLRERGAFARMLAVEIVSKVGYRDVRAKPLGIADEAKYKAHVFKMLPDHDEVIAAYQEGQFTNRGITFDDEGRELFTQFRASVEERLRPGKELYLLKDLGGKMPGMTARIAALLYLEQHPHALEGDIIPTIYLQRAINLMNSYYIPHALNIHGAGQGDSRLVAFLEKMAHLKTESPDVTEWPYTVVQRKTRMSAESLAEVLETLEVQNVLKVVEEKSSSRGGRKKRHIVLNPGLDLHRFGKFGKFAPPPPEEPNNDKGLEQASNFTPPREVCGSLGKFDGSLAKKPPESDFRPEEFLNRKNSEDELQYEDIQF